MEVWAGKVKGVRMELTRAQVMEALRLVKPRKVRQLAVEIGGVWYSIKQALGHVLDMPRNCMDAKQCRRVFETLGFRISTPENPLMHQDLQGRPLLKPRPEDIDRVPAEHEWLEIERIELKWSWWEWWMDIGGRFLGGAQVAVPRQPGVYEVKLHDAPGLLYIGKASVLQSRIVPQLVKGTGLHEAGSKIREQEELERVCVRWAVTDRPAAVEEELVRRYIEEWGAAPRYMAYT